MFAQNEGVTFCSKNCQTSFIPMAITTSSGQAKNYRQGFYPPRNYRLAVIGIYWHSSLVKKMIIAHLILIVLLVGVIAGCKTSRSAYQSAPYQTVRVDGKFELREYPALTVVETPMIPNKGQADDSFMRLFRFIAGANAAKQKIAMTTPVFMSGSESNRNMAFVMPTEMKPDKVPKPGDGTLHVLELPPGRFAVLRFSGGRNFKNEIESLRQLQNWMATQGFNTNSSPIYGYFDPPWTPTFLRRNEVMLRTDAASP